MNLRPVVIDVLVAGVIAVVVLIVSPGAAVDGLLAVLVLMVCGITLVVDLWRTRRGRRAGRAPRVRRR